MIEIRHGEIFKVRNPIRNLHGKLVDIHFRACRIEFKDPEMNKGGEYVYNIFANVQFSL